MQNENRLGSIERSRNVPQLRFPEFKEEWEKKYLGSISKNIAYGMNAAAKEFDGINKYIRITDIDERTRQFTPNPLTSPEGNIDEKYVLKEGDILFARTGASVGKSYLYNKNDGRLLFAGFLIKFNIFEAIPYFVFLQTFQERYNKWVQVYSMRSGQAGLNAEEYKDFEFYLCQIEEQQKIADFLTAIDSRLQSLEKKKSLLEEYKKGLMQQIFKQELRFRPALSGAEVDEDGKDFPDWEKKKLGDLCTFFSGGTPTSTNKSFYSGSIPFIGSGNISDAFVNNFITSEAFDSSSAKLVKEGDLLYALYGATSGEVAISKINGAINQAVLCIRTKANKYYLFQLLKFNKERIVETYIQGGQGNLSAKIVKELKFNFPSIAEQTKIANFLSALDTKIELVSEQIEKTKTYKKGLLQQMFV